ncbi:MAG: hypothetical protein M3321_05335, partial [Actinomycetota bacterium]|nr:hypothetical protein [Actinomycetota bacterium]
ARCGSRATAITSAASSSRSAESGCRGGGALTPSAATGGEAPGRDGAAVGHSKPLPRFVEKWQRDRAAAADLVARGQASPDASGVVTLKNGKFVRYRLQGEEYLTVALMVRVSK